ncbi:MAG: HAMP domain-containing sensor histidine kinase [Bacteroidales bacterium]
MEKYMSNMDFEQEILKMKTDLARKTDEVNRLKSIFLSNISHEIRTPMNVIVGFSNLLANPDYKQDQRNFFIEEINKNSRELLRIIDNIIYTAKFESEDVSPEMKICDVNSLIDEIKLQVDNFINDYNFDQIKIRVIKKPDKSKIEIFTDPDKLKVAILNLMENAIKYTIKGTVDLGYSVKDGKVIFYIKDTGEGIERKNLDKVREKFYQLESNTRSRRGLGVGLSVSDKLIRLLGGKLSLTSTLGKGSSFYFTLPLLVEKSV